MERLLAYEGPVVHVDHSHRAPAPTSWSNREEIEEEKRECAKHINKVHADCKNQSSWKDKRIEELQAQVVAKDDELVKSRDSKQRSIRKLMDQESEADAQIAELQQRVKSMTSEKETLLEYYTQKFKRVKELEADIERRNEADASRSVSIDNYYRETTELKLKVQELEERNRKLEAENEALQQQLLSEHDKLMQFRDNLKQARNDVENARASEGRMKSAIRQLEESKDVLKSQKATLIDSYNQLQKEKEALEAKLAGL